MAQPLLLSFLFTLSSLPFPLTTTAQVRPTTRHSNFSAALFFGDSTVDTGNNVYLPTPLCGDHLPYGQDLGGPTGRFSNGRLVPDLLVAALGIKQLSPPFLQPGLSERDLRTGVNFASAGSGLDDATSSLTGAAAMSRQLGFFGEYLGRLEGAVGEAEAKRIVGTALVLISTGGNDFILNFYNREGWKEHDISGYQDFLLGNLAGAIKSIYGGGGRRFTVAGLPPIGCLPIQITQSFKNLLDRRCVDEQMSDARAYNLKLQRLLPRLQQSLPGSKLAYLDITENVVDILTNPAKYGLEETRRGCCGTGLFETGPVCNTYTPICDDVNSFAFFDAVHPTERVYKLVADQIEKNVIPQLQ